MKHASAKDFGSAVKIPQKARAIVSESAQGYSDGTTVHITLPQASNIENALPVFDRFWKEAGNECSIMSCDGGVYIRVPQSIFVSKFGPLVIN